MPWPRGSQPYDGGLPAVREQQWTIGLRGINMVYEQDLCS